MQYCSIGHLFFPTFQIWSQILNQTSSFWDIGQNKCERLGDFEKASNFGFVYTQLLYLFKLFKYGLRFWIQLLVSKILDKTNVRGWMIFENANNFGFVYTELHNSLIWFFVKASNFGAPLLFKLFKSGLRFWIWDIVFYLFKASKCDLSIQQSSPSNLFRTYIYCKLSSVKS